MRWINARTLQKILTAVAILLILGIAIAIPVDSRVSTGFWRPVLTIAVANPASEAQTAGDGKALPTKTPENCDQIARVPHGTQGINCSRSGFGGEISNSARNTLLTVSVGDLATFYETIITILGVALAIVAGLAYWSVRLISIATAEDIARTATEKTISDSKNFSDSLRKMIKKYVDREMDNIRESLESIEDIETRITKLEQKFASEDDTEQTNGHIEGTGEKGK